MSDEPSDLLYLDHILERIRRIERCVNEGREASKDSHILQDAVMHNSEVIGEAVKQLSPALRTEHPEVPWRRTAGLRDVLIASCDSETTRSYCC